MRKLRKGKPVATKVSTGSNEDIIETILDMPEGSGLSELHFAWRSNWLDMADVGMRLMTALDGETRETDVSVYDGCGGAF